MSIDVSWFNEEKSFVLWKFTDPWTVVDYMEAAQHTLSISRQENVSHFDIISDLTESVTAPPDIIRVMKTIHQKASDRYGVTYIYGESVFVRHLIETMNRMPALKDSFIFVQTLEELNQRIFNTKP